MRSRRVHGYDYGHMWARELLGCPKDPESSMHDIGQAFLTAVALIVSFDPELIQIVALSLRVSLSATLIAMVIGAPIGGLMAVSRFPGRQVAVVLANALLGLPPVVVGLVIYLILSRSELRGFDGLLVARTG